MRIPSANIKYMALGVLALNAALWLVFHENIIWTYQTLPKYLNGFIAGDKTISSRLKRSKWLSKAGDLDGAKEVLEEAKRIDPNSIRVLKGLAESAESQGDIDGAVYWLEEMIRIDAAEIDGYLNAARLYAKVGNTAAARRVLNRGIRYFSRYQPKYLAKPNPSVNPRYNSKARKVASNYTISLIILRTAKTRLNALSQ